MNDRDLIARVAARAQAILEATHHGPQPLQDPEVMMALAVACAAHVAAVAEELHAPTSVVLALFFEQVRLELGHMRRAPSTPEQPS